LAGRDEAWRNYFIRENHYLLLFEAIAFTNQAIIGKLVYLITTPNPHIKTRCILRDCDPNHSILRRGKGNKRQKTENRKQKKYYLFDHNRRISEKRRLNNRLVARGK
jgi:hypothetical protein